MTAPRSTGPLRILPGDAACALHDVAASRALEAAALARHAPHAADATNRELVQLTMKGFQRYFEATMQLDEASGELRSYGALVNEDYGSVDKFASETGGNLTLMAE